MGRIRQRRDAHGGIFLVRHRRTDERPDELIVIDDQCRAFVDVGVFGRAVHERRGHPGQHDRETTASAELAGHLNVTVVARDDAMGDRQAQILDWKTHQVAITAEKLKANWQTQLYLYLLVKTTNYAPEQISMTYWFANTAQSVVINYSQTDYEITDKNIQKILIEISQAREYPKLDEVNSSACKHCEFRDRCDRGEIITKFTSNNLEDIPEIVV